MPNPSPEIAPSAFTVSRERVIIALHVQPGASQSRVCGMFGSSLKIALSAPPVDGKANKELLRFLSTKLDISKSQIALLSGETNRDKRVAVAGLTTEQIILLLSK